MSELQKQSNWKEWGVEMEVNGYFREDGTFRENLMKRKRFPVKQLITKNNIVLTYAMETPGDEDVEVDAQLYYIDANDDIHYIHMRNTNDEVLRLTNNSEDWGVDQASKNDQQISLK